MTSPHDESMLELASLRAIDALDAAEAAVIDRHMAECAECRAEFGRSVAAGTALAMTASSPAPESLRRRVLGSAVKIRRIRPWYQHPAFPSGAIAAAVLVTVGAWLASHRNPPSQTFAAACQPTSIGCSGDVVRTAGILRLEAHGMPSLPSGKVYQAWIIHPNEAPVPEPTFTTTSDGDGSVEMQASVSKGDVVAVTVEPDGGSASPTSKPLLVATLE
jgi:anti-sigma-K factor RskA